LGQELANDEVKALEAKADIKKFNLDGSPITAKADDKK
jgi:hypothetical protein